METFSIRHKYVRCVFFSFFCFSFKKTLHLLGLFFILKKPHLFKKKIFFLNNHWEWLLQIASFTQAIPTVVKSSLYAEFMSRVQIGGLMMGNDILPW